MSFLKEISLKKDSRSIYDKVLDILECKIIINQDSLSIKTKTDYNSYSDAEIEEEFNKQINLIKSIIKRNQIGITIQKDLYGQFMLFRETLDSHLENLL